MQKWNKRQHSPGNDAIRNKRSPCVWCANLTLAPAVRTCTKFPGRYERSGGVSQSIQVAWSTFGKLADWVSLQNSERKQLKMLPETRLWTLGKTLSLRSCFTEKLSHCSEHLHGFNLSPWICHCRSHSFRLDLHRRCQCNKGYWKSNKPEAPNYQNGTIVY